jgi:ElaB/YqjD/DUF883 family membrane-anchored ribosome-binding protein
METVNRMDTVNRERLAGDARQVLDDVQALLSQAAESSGQQAQELRSRAAEQLKRAQARLGELQQGTVERSRAAVHATDDWVHMHPWGAVGLGAGVGFLIGLLVARR